MQPEVFRQECMELRAPPEQAGPPVNGFQIPGGVASVQGVVGPRHVAELPKADTVPQQVFQEVGVQQQQVRQGGRHGDCRRELPGLVALRSPSLPPGRNSVNPCSLTSAER